MIFMLNEDQIKAKKRLLSWIYSPEKEIILTGRGGTGKTFLLKEFLKEVSLPKEEIIILAPTHEALKNLKDSILDFPTKNFKTIDSALGISPLLNEEKLKFEQRKLPSFWENIQLVLLDECSMLSELKYEILQQVHAKIVYIGDKFQLPEVKPNKGIFDPCVSTVFSKNISEISLTIPMRNSGELWNFTNLIQNQIESKEILYPKSKFDISKKEIKEFFQKEQNLFQLRKGELKLILWTNKGVKAYNERVRVILFPYLQKPETYSRYVESDRIILTSPTLSIKFMENLSKRELLNYENQEPLYTNTQGIIAKVGKTEIRLENNLKIPCFKLNVKHLLGEDILYEPLDLSDYDKIDKFYTHLAYAKKTKYEKDRAFREKHFILKCFAKIQHSYAGTSHRFQGSSITNVMVINDDIDKNPCLIERKKCRYVAVSRAMENLYMYRGI